MKANTKSARNEEMKNLYLQGQSLEEIGDKYSISKQRVHYILVRDGVALRPSKMDYTGKKKRNLTFVRPASAQDKCGVVWDALCTCGKMIQVVPFRAPHSCGCIIGKRSPARDAQIIALVNAGVPNVRIADIMELHYTQVGDEIKRLFGEVRHPAFGKRLSPAEVVELYSLSDSGISATDIATQLGISRQAVCKRIKQRNHK